MNKNMRITDILVRFDEITKHYVRELDKYSLAELWRKPSENEWSLGQMYLHLPHSTLNLQLRLAEQCMDPGGEGGGGKTEAGHAVFEQGSFPPVRIKVPAGLQYTPPQPESKEQLVAKLEEARCRMHEIGASLQSIDPERLERKAVHPAVAFGALNAVEWFAMVEMHYRHHLLQKERLDAFIHRQS
ncbi:DinB family protein [Paenibacillus sp. MER TA 81-3]|uniref:DinB family protein n=1 Tax=Paenibacillus sp. MER TA 81-3 TaxID=2939573 RepID=UPI00203E0CDD|nr:DinB family protein [Paenibacillus sp. MER TA 81-3]MCM3341631.1 DinB family protein [Paenibacillus sp. MER TA 81-3]